MPNTDDTDHDTLTRILEATGIGYADAACGADSAIARGWRPPGREIRTVAELDELPVGSIVVDREGDPWVSIERYDGGSRWRGAGIEGVYQAAELLEDFGPVVTR